MLGVKKRTAVSPERAALADAVARFKGAEARRNAVLKAEETAIRAVWEARTVMEGAEAAVTAAREEAVRQTVARLMGEDVAEASPVTRASQVAQDARVRHEDAIAARDILNARRGEDDRAVQSAAMGLDSCVGAVIAAEAAPRAAALAAEVIALQRELAAKSNELFWLVDHRAFPQAEGYTGIAARPADNELRQALIRLHEAPVTAWTDLLPRPAPSVVWSAARDALRLDPAAPLPGADR